jgi:hypothetical protein
MDKGEVFRNYQEESRVGELFKNYELTGVLDNLEEHLLKPIEDSAFELFKTTPAEQTERVIETQMMGKVIQIIRRTWEQKIQDGVYARQKLKDGLPEGGSDD